MELQFEAPGIVLDHEGSEGCSIRKAGALKLDLELRHERYFVEAEVGCHQKLCKSPFPKDLTCPMLDRLL
jgi:hypothetical protein